MSKYTYVQTYTTTFEVKAESIEEAEELLEQIFMSRIFLLEERKAM